MDLEAGPGHASGGGSICLPHLRQAFTILSNHQRQILAHHTSERLDYLVEELRGYIHKHAWDYRDEPLGTEQTSATRATCFVAGEREAW